MSEQRAFLRGAAFGALCIITFGVAFATGIFLKISWTLEAILDKMP